jgi:hypothetical protein
MSKLGGCAESKACLVLSCKLFCFSAAAPPPLQLQFVLHALEQEKKLAIIINHQQPLEKRIPGDIKVHHYYRSSRSGRTDEAREQQLLGRAGRDHVASFQLKKSLTPLFGY